MVITAEDRDTQGNIRAPGFDELIAESQRAITGESAPFVAPTPTIRTQQAVGYIRSYGPWALAALIAALVIMAMARQAPAAPASLVASPTAAATSAAPVIAPTVAAPLPVLAWPIDAFVGARHYVGPLAAERPYRVRGAADATWLEIDAPAHGGAPASGVVWVRAIDLITQPTSYGPTAVPPAPTAAPIVQQPAYQPPAASAICDGATAPYRVTRQVQDARGIPRGSITGWSCISQAEAETNAATQEAQLRATITAVDTGGRR